MNKKAFTDLVEVLPYLKKRGAFYFNDIEGFAYTVEPTEKWKNEYAVIVENWWRFYDFDAAADYENPSVFVAECIIEEALNKLEMEAYYEEMIDALENKHNK